MRTAYICIAIALTMVCIIPSQSIMQFTYECQGKNATSTTYSYLKEPRADETGYTRGLKSGSFNYLEDGNISLREEIKYDHGNGTSISNSTVDHSLTVEFDGKRGISEFFGRGFFGNNRWISAWKKIRYEVSPDMKINNTLMPPRPSNSIRVDASVVMDTLSKNVSYVFNYDAYIKNGVIEAKDSTGWTNRTGSRKYDWEYESRSVGDELNITNDLAETVSLKAAAPPDEDWLPCCYSGTRPTIDQLGDPWPSQVVKATLEANRLRPTRSLSSAYSASSGDSPIYWKREIQIGLSSRPSVPVQNADVSVISLSNAGLSMQGGLAEFKINSLLPTVHLSSSYVAPPREAKIGLRSLLPSAIVPLQMVVNSSSSVQLQEKANSSLFASVPVQSPANCIGDNCPANFFVSKNQSNLSCNDGACDGFECIYTYDEDTVGVTTAGGPVPLRRGETRNIHVTQDVFEVSDSKMIAFRGSLPEAAREERYKIVVTNNGDVPLSNVSATAEMAKGMKYVNSVLFLDPATGNLLSSVVPTDFDENVKTKVTWNFGTMQPSETRTVLMRTFQKKDMNVDNTDISLTAVGIAPDNVLVKNSVISAQPTSCEIKSDAGGPCTPEQIEWGICKNKVCPKWTLGNVTIGD